MASVSTSAPDQSHAVIVDGDDASKLGAEQVHTGGVTHGVNGGTGKEDRDDGIDITQLNLELSTLAVHADNHLNIVTDIAPPIHVSTTFRYGSDADKLVPFHERDLSNGLPQTEYVYSRVTSHVNSRFEAILSTHLKGPTLAYSSGLAAFNAILTHLVPKKVAIGMAYHGCHNVLQIYTRLTGATIVKLDYSTTWTAEELGEGDLIWLETPVNPYGTAFNIQHYADLAHSRGAYLGVDSTFAPPPLQNPFDHGADVIMHSGTKYIGGHSDMLCGVVAVRPDARGKSWISRMSTDRIFLGSTMGSMENWLGVRSLRTLDLRVKRQSESATRIVDALDGGLTGATVGTGLSASDVQTIQRTIAQVHHASLQTQSPPRRKKNKDADGNAKTDADAKADANRAADAEAARKWLPKQMPNGYGPVFAITMHDESMAKHLPSKLHLFQHATSLGGVESLIEWRAMSDASVDRRLLRVSIGVEDDRDLLDDLLRGLRALLV